MGGPGRKRAQPHGRLKTTVRRALAHGQCACVTDRDSGRSRRVRLLERRISGYTSRNRPPPIGTTRLRSASLRHPVSPARSYGDGG